ncbi:hypothetical protein LINPERHAP2_LOCUS7112 [Linum perenne]
MAGIEYENERLKFVNEEARPSSWLKMLRMIWLMMTSLLRLLMKGIRLFIPRKKICKKQEKGRSPICWHESFGMNRRSFMWWRTRSFKFGSAAESGSLMWVPTSTSSSSYRTKRRVKAHNSNLYQWPHHNKEEGVGVCLLQWRFGFHLICKYNGHANVRMEWGTWWAWFWRPKDASCAPWSGSGHTPPPPRGSGLSGPRPHNVRPLQIMAPGYIAPEGAQVELNLSQAGSVQGQTHSRSSASFVSAERGTICQLAPLASHAISSYPMKEGASSIRPRCSGPTLEIRVA